MKSITRVLFSTLCFFLFNIVIIKNIVYADVIDTPRKIIIYSPLYYLIIILVIAIVTGISIFILRKIYKINHLQKDEENVKGDEKEW